MSTDYKGIASRYAQRAHEREFMHRWGTHWNRTHQFVCLFDNNPFKDRVARRDEQLAEIKRRAAELGFVELAYAEYPERGVDEGYSYALLLGRPGSGDSPKKQRGLVESIRCEVWKEVGWNDPLKSNQ